MPAAILILNMCRFIHSPSNFLSSNDLQPQWNGTQGGTAAPGMAAIHGGLEGAAAEDGRWQVALLARIASELCGTSALALIPACLDECCSSAAGSD